MAIQVFFTFPASVLDIPPSAKGVFCMPPDAGHLPNSVLAVSVSVRDYWDPRDGASLSQIIIADGKRSLLLTQEK